MAATSFFEPSDDDRTMRASLLSRRRPALAAALLCVAGACATGGSFPDDASARAATDVPDAFTVPPLAPGMGDATCRSPVADPRDGARLHLMRSTDGRGDYQVPEGRYGVGARELLRIDCATGRVVGIVRQ
jgi:hypothetical protein